MEYIICSRCSKVVEGHNELALEMAWDDHVCAGKRNLDEMDMDLLREVAKGQLAEEEAWATHDLRRGN